MSEPVSSQSNDHIVGNRYAFNQSDVIGAGGLAVVYRGRDLKLRRPVAIKSLRPQYLASEESRKRFREEARMMGFAVHSNLPSIYDRFDQADGSWIVMELIVGQNLKQILQTDGTLPVEEVVRIVSRISEDLNFLHQRNVAHLDVKPQNIVITEDRTPRLLDLGVAQTTGCPQERIDGHAFGTAAYLAPEQGLGRNVDQRTDIYQLGCVAYELLTGRPPFQATPSGDHVQDVIDRHISDAPSAPSAHCHDLPEWLDHVVLKAIAKEPDARFPTAVAFSNALIDGLETGEYDDSPGSTTRLTPASAGPTVGHREQRGANAVHDFSGRFVRRSRPLRRTLWKLTTVVAIGNMILLLALIYRNGGASVFVPFLEHIPGASVSVSAEWLNLREQPLVAAGVAAKLQRNVSVTISGMPVEADGMRWWPVTVKSEHGLVRGWVWEGGISESWMMKIIATPSRIRATFADWTRNAWNHLPFILVNPLYGHPSRW